MEETQQCPMCGTPNEIGRALCKQCQSPLTAYAGDLGKESSSGRLAAQVAEISQRPPAVAIVAATDIAFAVFGPLLTLMRAFSARQTVNEEGTNYLKAAFGTLGPILSAIVLLPVAAALCVAAYGALTERGWGWMANVVSLGLLILVCLRGLPGLGAILSLLIGGVLLGLWLQPPVKRWFGTD